MTEEQAPLETAPFQLGSGGTENAWMGLRLQGILLDTRGFEREVAGVGLAESTHTEGGDESVCPLDGDQCEEE